MKVKMNNHLCLQEICHARINRSAHESILKAKSRNLECLKITMAEFFAESVRILQRLASSASHIETCNEHSEYLQNYVKI